MKKIYFTFILFVGLTLNAFSAKIPVKEWCEVNGIYTKYQDETNTAIHVCSFISATQICYYIPCDVSNKFNKLQKDSLKPSSLQNNLEPGILVPSSNGLIYYSGNINVIQETESQISITLN